MVQRLQELDLPNESLGRHGDGQLRVEHLDGDVCPRAVGGQEHTCGTAPSDLPLDGETIAHGAAHQGEEVAFDRSWSALGA
jgi:hypothetical protein